MAKTERRDSISDIAEYYSKSEEHNRLSLQQLEFAVTKRLLAKYLKPSSRILELGAGSGRYTLELAKNGHDVIAVEVVPSLVEQGRKYVSENGATAQYIESDARDFKTGVSGLFDAALIMGPLYHLISSHDRTDLVRDVTTVVKPGGLVISVHLTRVGVMSYMLARFPAWGLEAPDQIKNLMSTGHLPDHPRNGEFRGYFSSLKEIENLYSNNGLEIVRLHSQDPCIGALDEVYNRLPDDIKEAWADALTDICHDPLALGSGRGIICVSRVPSGK